MICTISPSLINVEESHNTLKFAARVKKIVTRAHTNQVMDDKALLEKYRREIGELKAQLMVNAAEAAEAAEVEAGVGAGVGIDREKHAELSHLLERERLKHEEEMVEMGFVRNALKQRIEHLTKLILTSQSVNSKPIYGGGQADSFNAGYHSRGGSSSGVGGSVGRYTVETTADGGVMEFPREIESRLARKDTIVRQLQSELELQQEKLTLMKNALQKTVKGESVDIERTLAKVESGYEPREKFLIEKRASILGINNVFSSGGIKIPNRHSSMRNSSIRSIGGLNAMRWQDGAGLSGPGSRGKEMMASPVAADDGSNNLNKILESPQQAQQPQQPQQPEQPQQPKDRRNDGDNNNDSNKNRVDSGSMSAFSEGEHLAIDDEVEDEDLMDTPWNREELASLRQAKRELEIVVIEQEKKLEEMVSFEDSEDFKNLVRELEEQREKIVNMEEERESLKASVSELKNTIRKLELSRSELGDRGVVPILMTTPPPSSSPSMVASASAPALAGSAAGLSSRVQELELMLQRERKLRLEEQSKSMTRVASLEAQVSILQAEQSVRELA